MLWNYNGQNNQKVKLKLIFQYNSTNFFFSTRHGENTKQKTQLEGLSDLKPSERERIAEMLI